MLGGLIIVVEGRGGRVDRGRGVGAEKDIGKDN